MSAGLGYIEFATGDVLTAASANGYLASQVVMVFASASARTTAITSPQEGMMSYLKDTNAVEAYDGSAWISVGSTGDITGVTAGTGISGGGTSGTVTVSIDTAVTADLTTAQTLTNKTLTNPVINQTINAQTGTTYTFASGDQGKYITASNASAQTYSIPTDATYNFPIGCSIDIIAIGAGQVTIQAASSGTTTVYSTGATAAAPKLRVQYSAATLKKVAANTWHIIGDLA